MKKVIKEGIKKTERNGGKIKEQKNGEKIGGKGERKRMKRLRHEEKETDKEEEREEEY